MDFTSYVPRKAAKEDTAAIVAEFNAYYRQDATEQQESLADDLIESFEIKGFLTEKQHGLLESIVENIQGYQNGA